MILNRSLNLCQSWCSQLKTEGVQLDHCGSSQNLAIQWFYISSTYTIISTFFQTIVQVTASLQIPCRRTLLSPLMSFRGRHFQFHSGLCPVQAQPSNRKHKNVLGIAHCHVLSPWPKSLTPLSFILAMIMMKLLL